MKKKSPRLQLNIRLTPEQNELIRTNTNIKNSANNRQHKQ